MALPVLIIGKSGSGKSASMRTIVRNDNFNVINVLGKPFPFRGWKQIKSGTTDDYNQVVVWLKAFPARSIIIDDAGYLITNQFMKGHSQAGAGNAIFSFYNKIGDSFWNLIEFVKNQLPKNKIIYFIMHEDTDDFGNIKPKTIGKLLDEKVAVEGMFTVVLRCAIRNGKHVFLTQTTERDVAKSPIDMFSKVEIDNDMLFVDNTIREYFEMEDN